MDELDYIGADDLVFNNDAEHGIYSGGFSVNSIMMKSHMSPIMTLNSPNTVGGGSTKVSDLFNDLVVPNWALSYNNRLVGGRYNEVVHEDNESDDGVVDDDLHDKLLDLVKAQPAPAQSAGKQPKPIKTTKRSRPVKKRNTKRRKH